MNKDLRIIFMGTPDFAVASLKTLVENNYQVVGVITAPDRPAGRGQKLTKSAVKVYAESQNIKVLQPEKLKNPDFISELESLKADLQVVVAFRMLPEIVWNMPTRGTFNLHASLLPQYRGAAPINWAIINGEKETGVTTFFIEKEIDTGNIIFQEKVAIGENDNAGVLHDKLMEVGSQLVLKTVDAIQNGEVKVVNQKELFNSENELKPAPKIFKEDCKIDWNDEIFAIYNKIRGLSPYPCAWTTLRDKEGNELSMKVYEANLIDNKPHDELSLVSDEKSYIHIQTPKGTIGLDVIQLSGKKRMDTKSFLLGNTILDYTIA